MQDWVPALVGKPPLVLVSQPGLKARPLVPNRPTRIEWGPFSPGYLYQPGLKGTLGRALGRALLVLVGYTTFFIVSFFLFFYSFFPFNLFSFQIVSYTYYMLYYCTLSINKNETN